LPSLRRDECRIEDKRGGFAEVMVSVLGNSEADYFNLSQEKVVQ
jgi:hypothetical protein